MNSAGTVSMLRQPPLLPTTPLSPFPCLHPRELHELPPTHSSNFRKPLFCKAARTRVFAADSTAPIRVRRSARTSTDTRGSYSIGT